MCFCVPAFLRFTLDMFRVKNCAACSRVKIAPHTGLGLLPYTTYTPWWPLVAPQLRVTIHECEMAPQYEAGMNHRVLGRPWRVCSATIACLALCAPSNGTLIQARRAGFSGDSRKSRALQHPPAAADAAQKVGGRIKSIGSVAPNPACVG